MKLFKYQIDILKKLSEEALIYIQSIDGKNFWRWNETFNYNYNTNMELQEIFNKINIIDKNLSVNLKLNKDQLNISIRSCSEKIKELEREHCNFLSDNRENSAKEIEIRLNTLQKIKDLLLSEKHNVEAQESQKKEGIELTKSQSNMIYALCQKELDSIRFEKSGDKYYELLELTRFFRFKNNRVLIKERLGDK